MWKTVEIFAGRWRAGPDAIRACSACAGDYEDPDRTAWVAEDEEGDEESALGGTNPGSKSGELPSSEEPSAEKRPVQR